MNSPTEAVNRAQDKFLIKPENTLFSRKPIYSDAYTYSKKMQRDFHTRCAQVAKHAKNASPLMGK